MQVYFNSITFLRCVDSQIEENKLWYSQFHIGPFTKGNSLMFSTRLRRTLIHNLSQTSILRIKFEGASNEFSRLPGIQEPVMDLIFQFRKVSFNAFFLISEQSKLYLFLLQDLILFMQKILLGHIVFIVTHLKFYYSLYLQKQFLKVNF